METGITWSRSVAMSSTSDELLPPFHAEQRDCTEHSLDCNTQLWNVASAWRMTEIYSVETYHVPGRCTFNRCLSALFKREFLLTFQIAILCHFVTCLRYFHSIIQHTVVPPYPRVILSKTYRNYVKQRIIPNAIYNVIFV
jgi:hypothetical protein